MDKSKNTYIGIYMAEHEKDADWMMREILYTLRSDNPEGHALRMIADMLDPSGKKGSFKLKLSRVRGNKSQVDDAYLDRIAAFETILDESETETEAIKTASMPLGEGGLGVSEVTSGKFLKTVKAIKAARAE